MTKGEAEHNHEKSKAALAVLRDAQSAVATKNKIKIRIPNREGGAVVNGNGNNYSRCIHNLRDDMRTLWKAPHILDFMDHPGISAEFSTYASLLQECVNRKALTEGKLVHAHMIVTGFETDIYLGTKLVIMYAKCGSMVDAHRVLDEMPRANVVSWTVMVSACTRHGNDKEALILFDQMQNSGIRPNPFTYTSVLPACANLAALEHGKRIHQDVIKTGYQSNEFVGNALVDMYAKCGEPEDARKVFDRMSERDVISWTAMIAGYAQNGQIDEALKLFQKMTERNVVSWTAMIAGYAQGGYVGEALKLFQKMPERNAVSWNAMIAGCVENGHVDEALKLFQKMPKQDIVSWNTMIAGHVQNGQFNEALNLFQQMQLKGLETDLVTFVSVLPPCASLAALKHGKEVHESIIRRGFQSNIFVASALVDMYAKCGSIHDACKVFEKMVDRDVALWNAMIGGYAIHGSGKEALQLFEEMQNFGTKPDHVTFVGVLSACCHAGLVDDGWQYFHRMSRDYHITPAVEHYCCLVDLMGRAGQLDEARELISKMPIKPNASVWGSLLGACRIHTNVELGEFVAEHLFELNPKNATLYVLLSNIYAAAAKWHHVERVRKLMRDRRVKRRPGCSWIEINNNVYSFLIGDRSHPQTDEIYAMLEKLSGPMRKLGYVPDTNFVLHDVEEQQKAHILCHHSEKLAIAFGLIHTSPGSSIRIIKNLRVCGDCHTATKFISKIVAREIVVRDANRFHHFKDGWCSCGDYW